ncbi:MAG: family 43 glycosylhydrolase [Micromonosporaceae bacterium]|nr:family 43 glycosylhydrolase [Micromonosporaceae bacterium]
MPRHHGLIGVAIAAVLIGALTSCGAGTSAQETGRGNNSARHAALAAGAGNADQAQVAATAGYANPLKGLGGACSDDDPYLAEGPNHTFHVYYARGHGCLTPNQPPTLPVKPQWSCESAKQWTADNLHDTYWVYTSTDPTQWTARPVPAMTICEVKKKDPSARRLWGAGALYDKKNQTYYLFYSVIEAVAGGTAYSIGVASSKSAAGPFTNHGIIIHGDTSNWYYGVHPFVDPPTGRIYLYFANHWKRIVMREFDPRTDSAPGSNTVILGSGLPLDLSQAQQNDDCSTVTADMKKAGHQPWEHCVIEHPEVFYAPHADADHRYFMLYNGAGGGSGRYAVGYAYSSSPTARFKRSTAGDNPILHRPTASGRSFYGPGAPNTFVDGAGTWWLFYRYYPQQPSGFEPRKMALNRLQRNGGKLAITPTIGVRAAKPAW